MNAVAALHCPQCKRRLQQIDWHDGESGSCYGCKTDFTAALFPALTRQRVSAKPQAVLVTDDASCYFHAQNQAEKVCDNCGRFVCSVCAIPFTGGLFCPSCLATRRTQAEDVVPQRILHDSLAFWLITLSLIIPFFGWFFSIVTAPLALGLLVYGWNKPQSVVHGRRWWRCGLAAVLSVAVLGLWIFVLVNAWLRPPHRG